MKMRGEQGQGEVTLLVGIIVIIVLGLFVWNHMLVPGYEKYIKKYDKPWWVGVGYQQVCPTFDDSEKCYSLLVTSNGDNVTRISFPNGGFLDGVDSGCYKAASGYGFDRFCRFWDQQNRLWGINPS